MKTASILFACLLAGCAVNPGEQLSLPAKMEIAGAAEGEKALLESNLSKALRAVNTWWSEHGAGFRGYPMRMPRASWVTYGPSYSSDPDVIGFAEDGVRENETQWGASTSKSRLGAWDVFYPTGLEYSFQWLVDVSGAEPKVTYVQITTPVMGWIDWTVGPRK